MPTPHACPECLRRSWLLADLAPHIEAAGSSRPVPELLALGEEELVAAVAPGLAAELAARAHARSARQMAESLAAADCWAICRHEERYPAALTDLAGPAPALIGRGGPGHICGLDPRRAVAIVGARRAASYGREVARSLGRELGAEGVLVISGLAFGIDACAHRGALDAGAPTIAVLGCGPDVAYPAAHRALWRRIAERGAVVSELPPGTTPRRWTFPARNRILAALAGTTVVVEAAHRSGSLQTARLAAGLGRTVGAVPGPITSRASVGPNDLLAAGARVVRGAEDVLAVHFNGPDGSAV